MFLKFNQNVYYFLVPRSLLNTSIYTDKTIIDPIKTCCQNALTSIRLRPFRKIPIIMPPANTPSTVHLPPKKLAPPIMQAAIASNSDWRPAFGYPESVLPAKINAPIPDKNPHKE